MISRKKLNFSIWDLIKENTEHVYYMPYSGFHKFKVNTQHCLKCNKELDIGFRKDEFIVSTCKCSADSKTYATLEKLSTLFNEKEAAEILTIFAEHKTRKLQNMLKHWTDQGYTDEEAEQAVSEVQTSRSARSPSAQKGARGYSMRTKEYWIKKGYTDLEAVQQVGKAQVGNGLDFYVTQYGIEEGQKRYNTRISQWLKKMTSLNMGISQVSISLFEKVDPDKNGRYGINETTVRGKLKVYRVDYLDSHKKKIIEFDGDYWHANPSKFSKTDQVRGIPVTEIWDRDHRKTQDLQGAGYDVLRVAEGAYNNDPVATIKKCKDFLDED